MSSSITFKVSEEEMKEVFDLHVLEEVGSTVSYSLICALTAMHILYKLVMNDKINMADYMALISHEMSTLRDDELQAIAKYSHKNTPVGESVRKVITERILLSVED